MSIIKKVFMQECSQCGCRFPAVYVYDTERKSADLEYDESKIPCKCGVDFLPAEGVPSVGEWWEKLSKKWE